MVTAPRCARCKRLLRDEVSTAFGLGPVCRRRLGIAEPAEPTTAAPRRGRIEGQLALEEIDEETS